MCQDKAPTIAHIFPAFNDLLDMMEGFMALDFVLSKPALHQGAKKAYNKICKYYSFVDKAYKIYAFSTSIFFFQFNFLIFILVLHPVYRMIYFKSIQTSFSGPDDDQQTRKYTPEFYFEEFGKEFEATAMQVKFFFIIIFYFFSITTSRPGKW